MNDSTQDLVPVSDEQAREVGLPSPSAIQYMMSVANMLITSNLLGPDLEPSRDVIQSLVAAKWEQSAIDEYRDKVVKSNALAKMLIGREMHMSAMESLQDISIVKSKMFVHYSQLIGQIERKGYACKWVERSNERAALLVSRNGDDTLFEFSIEDAQRAGLLNSPPGKEAYNQYRIRPRVMLTARVASEAYRVTGGRANVYTPEEKPEVLGSESSTGEPSAADAERMAQLQQRYHVGPKPGVAEQGVGQEASPEAPAVVNGTTINHPAPAAPAPAAASGPKPKTEKKAKPADSVLEMPAAQAQPTAAPAATNEDSPVNRVSYIIYALPVGSDTPVRLSNEPPQFKSDVASLRAQALANQFGVPHYVYPAIDGTVNRVSRPVFTAQAPEKNGQSAAPPPAPPTAAPEASPATPAPAQQVASANTASTGTTDAKPSPLRERLTAVSKSVTEAVNRGLTPDKAIPEKTVAARVKTFFQGYFGVATLKDLPPVDGNEAMYDDAFLDLESVAAQDSNVLLSAPEDTGKRLKASTLRATGLLRHELKWNPDNVALGFALMRLRALDFQDMQVWLENSKLVRNTGNGMESAAPEDIRAALQICLATRQGGRFIRECNEHNLSVAATLHWMEERRFMGKKLAEVSAADVDRAIEWAGTAIKERAAAESEKSKPPAPKRRDPEPPAAPAPPADDEGGLFEDLP